MPRQHDPERSAHGAGQVGGGGIDTDHQVEAGDEVGGILEVGGAGVGRVQADHPRERQELGRQGRRQGPEGVVSIGRLTARLGLPVSADTSRSVPARAALEAGARLINDVSGLHLDPALAGLAAEAGAGLVLMASPAHGAPIDPMADPIAIVRDSLERSLALARAAGIPDERILLDPGIGFFRGPSVAWPDWDCRVLADLPALHALGRPLHVGVSRKSFIGALAGVDDPTDRLPGSLAAAAAAVLGGAHVIRAHDVAETVQAVRVAQALQRARERAAAGVA